jgi:hypothetical protein
MRRKNLLLKSRGDVAIKLFITEKGYYSLKIIKTDQ